jgi:hypothetical protein
MQITENTALEFEQKHFQALGEEKYQQATFAKIM